MSLMSHVYMLICLLPFEFLPLRYASHICQIVIIHVIFSPSLVIAFQSAACLYFSSTAVFEIPQHEPLFIIIFR